MCGCGLGCGILASSCCHLELGVKASHLSNPTLESAERTASPGKLKFSYQNQEEQMPSKQSTADLAGHWYQNHKLHVFNMKFKYYSKKSSFDSSTWEPTHLLQYFQENCIHLGANSSTERLSLVEIMVENPPLVYLSALSSLEGLLEESASESTSCFKCVCTAPWVLKMHHIKVCNFNCDFSKHWFLKWPAFR